MDFKNEYVDYLINYYDEKLDEVEKRKLPKPVKTVATSEEATAASPLIGINDE